MRARDAETEPLILLGDWPDAAESLIEKIAAHPDVVLTRGCSHLPTLAEDIDASLHGFRSGILYGKEYHALWSDHLRDHARGLIENFYRHLAEIEKKSSVIRYWGDANRCHEQNLALISEILPDARFLHISSGHEARSDGHGNRALERAASAGRVFRLGEADLGTDSNQAENASEQVLEWLGLRPA